MPSIARPQSGATAFEDYEAGRYVEAIRKGEAALAEEPDNPVWWALVAETRGRLGRHRRAATAFAHAASSERDAEKRSYFLRAQALQSIYAGMYAEAREVVASAKADPSLGTRNSLDWAMIAISAGDDRTAQEILGNEAIHADFTRQTALDAAYSAKREGLDERAVQFFEAGLALDTREAQPLDPARREAIRRENRELGRKWSFLSQGSYSSAGRPVGPLDTPPDAERAAQFGAEIAHRIDGWRNGRPFSIFGRLYHSEFLSSDQAIDRATQGWLGVRYKPLAQVNLNLEASRLFAIDDGLDDWSLRAAMSGGKGLEPGAVGRSWTYAHAYGDMSYLTRAGIAFGLAEGRLGRSFSLGESATTLTPYGVTRLDLDSGRAQEEALGVGAGISLRHRFDGTDTIARRGFVEFDLQARQRIAGDRRATGLSASLTLGR